MNSAVTMISAGTYQVGVTLLTEFSSKGTSQPNGETSKLTLRHVYILSEAPDKICQVSNGPFLGPRDISCLPQSSLPGLDLGQIEHLKYIL